MKLCWVLHTYGQVIGWSYATMNRFDTAYKDEAIILADLGLRAKKGNPDNLKLCPKGTWNERMVIETVFSLLTVVCHAKKMFHRRWSHLEARFADTAAMFNVLLTHSRHDAPTDAFSVNIAQFSL